MDPLLVLPPELEIHRRLFDAAPLEIVRVFLECFNAEGRQALLVPRHVLEALAVRFLQLVDGDTNSLDEAFGGRIARQRNRILERHRSWTVLWRLEREKEKVAGKPPSERGAGTPSEIAVERVAEYFEMSTQNVRRIFTAAGKF